ncbi:hypothetical protein DMB42_17980 [Nonomuraea sp. WAC 01424]|uniref:hypothetical protein n=1 Tax=Nonomuraea sp. WAC 01424 TaxID=2203200 RepID=UPI000F792419|nr:hypothetical protein [Nonomuraea sp. WAC 01424]RSN09205.1 hypothetical protein DMB42_17980 [Nonomuraea sp. WAC 01424]
MKISRLHSVLLAAALSASVLAGVAPAFAATQSSASVAGAGWPTPDWYLQGPYQTLAACDAAYEDAAQNGQYTGLVYCHWFRGGGPYLPGFYYEVYIP